MQTKEHGMPVGKLIYPGRCDDNDGPGGFENDNNVENRLPLSLSSIHFSYK